jgi:general secretion pathway protein F
MPVFSYRAADRAGRTIDGVMEAHDPQAVIERLHREEYFPVRVERADGRPRLAEITLGFGGTGSRVPARDLLAFTQQLSTLVDAGIPLDRALTILADLSGSARLRQIVQDVGQSVRTGSTLADALSRHHPRPFSRLYINTVRAGEKGGVLEAALRRLAEHLEQTRELREALTSATIYPALLITVGVGAVIFLMTFVLPRFAVIFADLGQELPLPTRILLAVSHGFTTYWWVLGLVVVAALLTWQLVARSEPGRLAVDRWLLGLPAVGDLARKIEVGRFARTLGTLLHSGVPLLAALGVAREVAGNRVIGLALGAVQEGAKRGDGLARPMAETGAFPSLAIHMVRVGEETGKIEDMLERVAASYEGEIRVAVRRFIALLEPVIILGLGLVVLGIVLAILLAILSINELPL